MNEGTFTLKMTESAKYDPVVRVSRNPLPQQTSLSATRLMLTYAYSTYTLCA